MLYDDLVPKGEYLCHHGVKGQKWGVRHDREKSSRKNKNLKWSVDKKYKNMIRSSYNNIPISMFNDTKYRSANMKTANQLVNNWDKLEKIAEKSAKNFSNEWFAGRNMGNLSLESIWIGGGTPVFEYGNDYGVVSVEMNPNNGQVYYVHYDD